MAVFPDAGPQHTDSVLAIARSEALARGIGHVLVASTVGDTGVKAAELFEGTGVRVVVITHNTGFKKPGESEFDPEKRKRIEALGGVVYTGTIITRSLGAAIRGKDGYTHEQLVADTLRIFGQGVKVCVEMAAMASDAGLCPAADVIAVAGTGRGADTCVLLKADSSNRFFDIRVREILAKPSRF